MASWLRRTSLLMVAAAVLAGCTTSDGASEDADRVLGDLASIQPCSLTALDVFAEFGSAEFGSPESLDFCTVVVKPGGSDSVSLKRDADAEEVTIMIGELTRPSTDQFLPTDKLEDVNDGIHTTKPEDADVSCWQTLVFVEADLALSVRSRMGPLAKPTPTCDMVAAGMAKVVEVIQAGKVEHRSPAPNSLITLDPCDLVADEKITALPGYAKARRVESPGGHRCYWQTSPGIDTLRASVSFGVAKPPEPSTISESNADPIADRPSVTSYSDKFCEIETGHIPFEEITGVTGIVETVELRVALPPGQVAHADEVDQEAACGGALAIAEELWPRLPSA